MAAEPACRPAVVADLPMILRTERQYMQAIEPANLARWTSAVDRNLALWIENLERTTILVVDGRTAGYVMWCLAEVQAALLITVQVLPAYRRRGLGLQLLEVFSGQARGRGATVLRLGAHEANPARPLYDAAGYRVTGRDQAYVLYEKTAPPGDTRRCAGR